MDLIGGPEAAGLLHRVAALVTMVYFVLEVAYIVVQIVTREAPIFGPDSMMWQKKDLTDIGTMFRWFFGQGPVPAVQPLHLLGEVRLLVADGRHGDHRRHRVHDVVPGRDDQVPARGSCSTSPS